MGKKKNKKFNKVKSKAQINQIQEEVSVDGASAIAEVSLAAATATSSMQAAEAAVDPRYILIRKEVKKVLLTILILFLVLIGTYIFEQKTGMLDNVGGWIYRVSHIQTE